MGGVVVAVPGCCFVWALGHCLWALGHHVVGGWAAVCGCWVFVGRLFVDWVVVCGSGGAVCSQFVKSDGMSEGRVLTIVNSLNNNNE